MIDYNATINATIEAMKNSGETFLDSNGLRWGIDCHAECASQNGHLDWENGECYAASQDEQAYSYMVASLEDLGLMDYLKEVK